MKDDCGSDQGQSSRRGLLNQRWESAASSMGWIYRSRTQSQGEGQLLAGSEFPHLALTGKKQYIYFLILNAALVMWQGRFLVCVPFKSRLGPVGAAADGGAAS